jgi:uncharacterized repeat protein (TIGR03803 family)
MHPTKTNGRMKVHSNVANSGPRYRALTLSVICALLLIAARPALAQTETVVYNFAGSSDGSNPNSTLTSDGVGNFYGTTNSGGTAGSFGYGTVFELSPNGSGGWNETVLYRFTGGADGASPAAGSNLILDGLGNLYGTTYSGGANGDGVVFELSRTDNSWDETVLYSFASGTGGANPQSGLIFDSAGNLYGTTSTGGANGLGTVFKLSRFGGWTERAIYPIFTNTGCSRGSAGLTMDSAGNIFGVGCETVFELSPKGKGGWNSTAIYTFPGSLRDGVDPQGTPVLDKAGNLYGTTWAGGSNNHGMVYKLSPGKTGWTEKSLYSFKGPKKDGNGPGGLVFDTAGNIYGTTFGGGGGDSYGAIFELVAAIGKGRYQEKILWSFEDIYKYQDGIEPVAGLVLDGAGNLYGTTSIGGNVLTGYCGPYNGCGLAFKVTP